MLEKVDSNKTGIRQRNSRKKLKQKLVGKWDSKNEKKTTKNYEATQKYERKNSQVHYGMNQMKKWQRQLTRLTIQLEEIKQNIFC